MNTEQFLASIAHTYADCNETACKKNHDYAGSQENPFKNFEAIEYFLEGKDLNKIGATMIGMLCRELDKFGRKVNLLTSEAQVDEKIEETISDHVNYLAIQKAYIESQK